MRRIEAYMEERTGAILKNQRESKALPETGDEMVDGLMRFMLQKASSNEIQFDVTILEKPSGLIEAGVPAIKLETLCADCIENAIIAASHSAYRKILVTFGTHEGFHELNIQDSGIPFEAETLPALGVKRASTHLDDGGSGIGYMTIFGILRELKASLIITEYEPRPYGFTKSVKIRFDNKNAYEVVTFRADELREALGQSAGGPAVMPLRRAESPQQAGAVDEYGVV